MKRIASLLVLFLVFAAVIAFSYVLAGCSGTNLADAQRAAHEFQQGVQQQQAASTQPGSTVPAPPKAVVKAAGQAVSIVDAAANAGNPGAAIEAAAPLSGPAAPWVYLAGVVVSVGYGLWQRQQAAKAVQALTTANDGLAAAISTGAITVTPAAAAVVDAAVTSHPQTDRLVDNLTTAAGKTK